MIFELNLPNITLIPKYLIINQWDCTSESCTSTWTESYLISDAQCYTGSNSIACILIMEDVSCTSTELTNGTLYYTGVTPVLNIPNVWCPCTILTNKYNNRWDSNSKNLAPVLAQIVPNVRCSLTGKTNHQAPQLLASLISDKYTELTSQWDCNLIPKYLITNQCDSTSKSSRICLIFDAQHRKNKPPSTSIACVAHCKERQIYWTNQSMGL